MWTICNIEKKFATTNRVALLILENAPIVLSDLWSQSIVQVSSGIQNNIPIKQLSGLKLYFLMSLTVTDLAGIDNIFIGSLSVWCIQRSIRDKKIQSAFNKSHGKKLRSG